MVTLYRTTREYTDVDFSFEKHPESKNLLIKKNGNAVKQSIINLLLLKNGDKPFHPEIKSPVFDSMFEIGSLVQKVILEGEIYKYLSRYEPRIVISQVVISYDQPNAISCSVKGEIINIQEPFEITVLIDRIR